MKHPRPERKSFRARSTPIVTTVKIKTMPKI